jgi:hypothetical protein
MSWQNNNLKTFPSLFHSYFWPSHHDAHTLDAK